ncbi:MAG TPA: hypothetical protein VJA27_00900 [Patescibacteria group bacterium]|nr:hypothetical protein [Patescibacteria group bacterium]
MKFRYKKFSPAVLRPVVPVAIKVNNNMIMYEVLIDSGADMCIFDAEIGEVLGLNIEQGEPHPVAGVIAGQRAFYYNHSVTLIVGGVRYDTVVGFSRHISRCGYGIVGQRGFFDKFIVKFDLRKEEVELK